MVVTSCRQGAADLIEKAEIAPGERFVKPLPEALPQGERTLQGLAGAVDLPGIRADDPEPVRGRGLAQRFGQLPPERERLDPVLRGRPQLTALHFQSGERIQGLGFPPPLPERAPARQRLAVQIHSPVPRLGRPCGNLLAGAAHQRQSGAAAFRGCRDSLDLDRVAPRPH